MAEKESVRETIGNGQQQQQAGYQMPSLTSKPLKQDLKSATNKQSEPAAPSGYYFNVAQKGKLILPTALWILLVLAGVSFLTLLASLNRTVDTLDTLIEFEQEKAALENLHGECHNYNHHDKKPNGKEHDDKERHHDEKNWPDRVESSWLALPSWASLEPIPREPSKQAASHPHNHHAGPAALISSSNADNQLNSIPPQLQSSMDDLFRQSAGLIDKMIGGNSMPEVSGSFIISTSSSKEANSQKPVDMVDSILKQMGPLFAKPELAQNKNRDQKAAAMRKSSQERDQDRPLLSANIENLNINVNINGTGSAQSDDFEEKAGADRKRRPTAEEREESNGLEQSLNSLISKLLAPPVDLAQGPFRPEAAGQPLDLLRPGSSLDDDNIRHRRPQSLPSGFIMPIEFGSLEPRPIGVVPSHRPQAVPDQFIISLASDEPQTSGPLSDLASMLANGGLAGATRTQTTEMNRPQLAKPASPYELAVGSPMSALLDSIRDFEEVTAKSSSKERQQGSNKPSQDETQRLKGDTKWDVLANDLAESLVSSMIPEKQVYGEPFGLPQTLPDMPIVLVNGKPLDESEQQKFPLISTEAASSLHKGKDDTEAESNKAPSSASTDRPEEDLDMGDLFSFLIGSRKPSTSSTKSLDQTTAAPDNTDKSMSLDKLMREMTDKLSESLSTPSTTADDSKANSQTKPAKDSLSELLNAHVVPTTTSSTSAADERDSKAKTKESEHDLLGESVLNDLLGGLFTMPQFGNDQPSRSTSDSSSGSSSSVTIESPVSVVAQKATTTTTTETVSSSTITETSTSVPDQMLNSTESAAVVESQSTESFPTQSIKKVLNWFKFGSKVPQSTEVVTSSPAPVASAPEVKAPSTTITSTLPTVATSEQTTPTIIPKTAMSSSTMTSEQSSPLMVTSEKESSTPSTEVIPESEVPVDTPVIDSTPFAKSTTPTGDEVWQRANTQTSSSVPPPTEPVSISTLTSKRPTTVFATPAAKNELSTEADKTDTKANTTGTVGNMNTTKAPLQTDGKHATGKLPKSFLERADDFIERNMNQFRKLF